MRYEPINNHLFVENRKQFCARMKPNSIAIFYSNDIMPTNADGTMPFKQNSDLFYLTGIDQEETTLVLFPDAINENHREILFVKETNDHIAIWEGAKLDKIQSTAISGIQTVIWGSDLDILLAALIPKATSIYLNSNEHGRASTEVETRNNRLGNTLQREYPLMKWERAAPILHQLRFVKSAFEIKLIQYACNITNKAFHRILNFTKAGKMEYELEAEITHEFLINRSRGHAYQTIIAGGKNACILHYIENNDILKDGDLILMDFGAEYANYNADMTRVIPVSGKFSERQKAVYNSVLHVMKEAKKMLIPNNNWESYNKEVGKLMEQELISLKLLDKTDVKNQDPKQPLYRQHFMHGTSHSLGLDVHDVDDRSLPFAENMVFTCEPGIYIPKENIGIRIENDIVIKSNPIDLMGNIPITVEEIEELMNEN
jgi:Xaa-Pro aminopeptidase